MIHEYLKMGCEGLAALFALAAAYAWFRAARAPIPFIEFPDSSDPDAVNVALACYEGFQQGTVWNKRAAALAGLSAFATFSSWLVGSFAQS